MTELSDVFLCIPSFVGRCFFSGVRCSHTRYVILVVFASVAHTVVAFVIVVIAASIVRVICSSACVLWMIVGAACTSSITLFLPRGVVTFRHIVRINDNYLFFTLLIGVLHVKALLGRLSMMTDEHWIAVRNSSWLSLFPAVYHKLVRAGLQVDGKDIEVAEIEVAVKDAEGSYEFSETWEE
ncbi:hypothetical protein NX059_012206 [Plenodomus lindquistii]|nr:hypothetical protein NX059_012206 [Plenodomus lindquistii]